MTSPVIPAKAASGLCHRTTFASEARGQSRETEAVALDPHLRGVDEHN